MPTHSNQCCIDPWLIWLELCADVAGLCPAYAMGRGVGWGGGDTAADQDAAILFTPKMSGLLDRDRDRVRKYIVPEDENPALEVVRNRAA